MGKNILVSLVRFLLYLGKMGQKAPACRTRGVESFTLPCFLSELSSGVSVRCPEGRAWVHRPSGLGLWCNHDREDYHDCWVLRRQHLHAAHIILHWEVSGCLNLSHHRGACEFLHNLRRPQISVRKHVHMYPRVLAWWDDRYTLSTLFNSCQSSFPQQLHGCFQDSHRCQKYAGKYINLEELSR